MSSKLGGYGYRLVAPAQPLERYEFSALEPQADEVVVEVAGCGVCHTDVGFAYDGVPTRAPLPLTLGHEISGRVVAAGERVCRVARTRRHRSRRYPLWGLRSLPSRPAHDLPAAVHARQ